MSPLPHRSLTHALFAKRIEGDDWLMKLAQLRFQHEGMQPEMYADSPEELEWLMRFNPSPASPIIVHLPRELNLLESEGRRRVLEFASRFAGRVGGWVVHDRREMAARSAELREAAGELNSALEKINPCPCLFIEYASGLEPRAFAALFAALQPLEHVSACIDIGHVGVWQARHSYAQTRAGEDICALKSSVAQLPQVIAHVDQAVSCSLPAVLSLITVLGQYRKPLHLHLHDGHPLSTVSAFGVSDHLSFLEEIPLGFDYQGRQSLPLMFGPSGLSEIVARSVQAAKLERVSFTLEIHPTRERLPLGDAALLFTHWRDKTNAERMNHWLDVLAKNHRLLTDLLAQQTTSHIPRK
jgi:hypothetical protein